MNPLTGITDPAKQFEFVGGDVSLDFCNTMGGSREGIPREYLNSYGDFVFWAQQAGLLDKAAADALLRKAAALPEDVAVIYTRALNFREALYRIFVAVADGKTVQGSDLSCLNAELSDARGRLRVESSKGGFRWVWRQEAEALDQPIGPIASAAADLLTDHHELQHVRQCGGDNCGWLFIDSSKNHSRRWCDMRDCGNRAKVRRHRMKERRMTNKRKSAKGLG